MADPKDIFKGILEKEARKLAPDRVIEALIEKPKNPAHGDLSSNIALQLAKPLGRKPRDVAEDLKNAALPALIESGITTQEDVSIAGPGFLNVRIIPSFKLRSIHQALKAGAAFGHTKAENPGKVQENGGLRPNLGSLRYAAHPRVKNSPSGGGVRCASTGLHRPVQGGPAPQGDASRTAWPAARSLKSR